MSNTTDSRRNVSDGGRTARFGAVITRSRISRGAVIASVAAVVTGGALMVTGQAFAASTPKPTPTVSAAKGPTVAPTPKPTVTATAAPVASPVRARAQFTG